MPCAWAWRVVDTRAYAATRISVLLGAQRQAGQAALPGPTRQQLGGLIPPALAVPTAVHRQHDPGAGLDAGLIPITVPELLRLLRDTVIPPPRRDRAHRLHWSTWRRRHQHRARQAHQRWNHYAETTP